MKLLLIGATGMAGHVLERYFREQADYRVFSTSRETGHPERLRLELTDSAAAREIVRAVRPDVIVNCAGILNEDASRRETMAYEINGLLPHRLAREAEAVGARLVHISSDCVFSGKRGRYTESDEPDGTSVYARTKRLGEVHAAPHTTIRTSIIGPEVREGGIGLMQWFLRQTGRVTGYVHVPWNGVTTLELAKAVREAIERPVAGLVHLTSVETITKHDLLLLIQDIWDKTDVEVVPYEHVRIDRTLVATRNDWTYRAPGYRRMLEELRDWTAGRE
ncbi:dTDP-4-dehydrorhamnose reductase family protein [Paenibacillus thermoaerophilus]|uniref:dTDP-4-dehydrorhamnose reductase n=1 Tax=Paenibacillus thermoaerophilus TaxID=1215385 RepID=A0ABW2V7K6_9BACL|nr:SDR family oxidoreductase [Paenibacillus thermoaerophilus]TMV17796.1 SDR family oxidoreductase [Paenibacillus thermoaerophilus]